MARGSNRSAARRDKPVKPPALIAVRSSTKDDTYKLATGISLELQQKCLDIFRNAFNPGAEDNATLQEVKGHLYNRDFATAFGKNEYLRVYASRWSPSRALAYAQVFVDIESFLEPSRIAGPGDALRAVSLGGGAGGELVGLAGWLSSQLQPTESAFQLPRRLQLNLVDITDWSQVTDALHEGVTRPPELSKYASQAKRDANRSLLEPDNSNVNFHRSDVLNPDEVLSNTLTALFEQAQLVTFMFTLNELYSTSMPKTQDFLARLTASMQPGSLLLVVDSPGSYSTVSINGTEKKYPMQWLLDYTLLGSSDQSDDPQAVEKWQKLINDSSRWFRLPKSLHYPIELEDMRYQIHLYKRLGERRG